MPSSLRPEQLRQVQLVPITGFDAQGRLNLEVMQENTQRLLAAGVKVFIPCAGSSEFHSLSADEIVAPVGLQVGHALDVSRRSLEAGADCVLVMPLSAPYLSDAGTRDYYHALLSDLDCPLLIYKKSDIPSDPLLLELAGHPGVIGVKYAVNDIDAFHRVVRDDEGRIDWFCGSAERYAPFFMLAGATGYTSGAGNICPHLTLAMFEACQSGDWAQAMRLQQIIRPIEDYRAKAGSSYNVSFLKYAARRVGLNFGPPRPPQRRLTAEEQREIDALLEPILEADRELAEAPAGVR
jgi:4-hydroxy-tetrahydrodipicolinate synthase